MTIRRQMQESRSLIERYKLRKSNKIEEKRLKKELMEKEGKNRKLLN